MMALQKNWPIQAWIDINPGLTGYGHSSGNNKKYPQLWPALIFLYCLKIPQERVFN